MNKYEYKVVCPQRIPENIPLDQELELVPTWEWNAPTFGDGIGRIDSNGNKKSLFKSDTENGNTDILDACIENLDLIEIDKNIRNDGCIERVTVLYVPYVFTDHIKFKPTIDCEVPWNSKSSMTITYELLFVAENSKRYVEVPFKTVNVNPLLNLYEEFKDFAEEHFQDDDGLIVDFYKDNGERDLFEFEYSDLMDCLVSARIVGVDDGTN
ncbi:hypothetical protein SAMN04488579_12441 [Eubacterium barkeri]|uniref:Uncharacterized protein n=2 Tax=Eubacterium barkeri TaxID=1528 RepID=A0A1H3IQC2_EUBBA|nr:hypothetical protein SAMN04488579_12441 [Eubacterium barkeri]